MSNSNIVKGKKFIVEASGRAVGRVATEISMILMGKNETDYLPHVDKSNKVQVKGVADVFFTGKKAQQKVYRHHSNYPGGLKEKQAKEVLVDPKDAILLAVSKMLPKNKMRETRLKRISFK